MRFSVELLLDNTKIPKDKNRIIISLIKNCFESYNSDFYKKLYEEKSINKSKDFTFSMYMRDCIFLRDEIEIPDKKIILNFSTYSPEEGIMFYNSFLNNKGKKYNIKNNTITIGKMRIIKEKNIFKSKQVFRTKSPIVVREHKGDNKKTWYHSLNNEEGLKVFKANLKYQLTDALENINKQDIDNINITLLKNAREVKVKNYSIEVLSNLVDIEIEAQPYILDYLYKAGVGSKRNSGFGMLEIL